MVNKAASHIAAYLFIFLLSVYLLTAPGYIHEADVSQLRMAVAESIVDRFDLSVSSDIGMQGSDGRSYSWFGIGPVLATVPLYLTSKLTGVAPAIYVLLFNLLIGAASTVLLFLFISYLGYSLRASFLASLCYGLGTMAWYYTKDPGDHATETFLILLTIYYGYRYSSERIVSDLLLTAFFLGLSLLTRPTSLLIVPALIYQLLPKKLDSNSIKRTARATAKNIALFLIVFLPFVCLFLWYNYYRFGSVFETGYGLIAARLGLNYFDGTQLLTGLEGLLLSPGKGYFYYTPIAALFIFSLKSFFRKNSRIALCFSMIILSYVAFYSKYIFWHGCTGWGPRFIFVITPFLIIPVASLFDSVHWTSRKLTRCAVYALFIVSLSVQVASVSLIPSKYDVYLQINQGVRYEVAKGDRVQPIISPPVGIFFDWRKFPIVMQFKFMREVFTGLSGYNFANDTKDLSPKEEINKTPWMNLFDFWWIYMYFSQRSISSFMVVAILLSASIYYLRKVCVSIKCLEEQGKEHMAHHENIF